MDSKIVFSDSPRYDEGQKAANVEDNHKKGALFVSKSHKITGGNKIALPTVPTAQISGFRVFVKRKTWAMAA
jgi:hypothetical protein